VGVSLRGELRFFVIGSLLVWDASKAFLRRFGFGKTRLILSQTQTQTQTIQRAGWCFGRGSASPKEHAPFRVLPNPHRPRRAVPNPSFSPAGQLHLPLPWPDSRPVIVFRRD